MDHCFVVVVAAAAVGVGRSRLRNLPICPLHVLSELMTPARITEVTHLPLQPFDSVDGLVLVALLSAFVNPWTRL